MTKKKRESTEVESSAKGCWRFCWLNLRFEILALPCSRDHILILHSLALALATEITMMPTNIEVLAASD